MKKQLIIKQKNIIPLVGYILVDKIEIDEKNTKSGIIVKTDRPQELPRGTVVGVSSQRAIGNRIYPSQILLGDIVYFELKGPNRVILDDHDYYLVKEEDVLGLSRFETNGTA